MSSLQHGSGNQWEVPGQSVSGLEIPNVSATNHNGHGEQSSIGGMEIPTLTIQHNGHGEQSSMEDPFKNFSHDWEIDAKTGMTVRRRKLF